MWLWIRYAETLYIIKFKILQNFFSVWSLKEIIIIIIIIPEILFDTEYIAFSVYIPIISVSSVIDKDNSHGDWREDIFYNGRNGKITE